MKSDFPFAGTEAMLMMQDAIKRKKSEGVSLRSIGRSMGYKQPTVLSHMASGRVQIPIKRAQEIAFALDLDPAQFLAASIKQREPGASDLLAPITSRSTEDRFVTELAVLAQKPLAMLTEEQRSVLREVVADPTPRRRWLSLPELPVVLDLRRRFPQMVSRGLNENERKQLDLTLDRD